MDKQNNKSVKASPTKRFFVDMLTRDIELADAILDLLDNCVDGILRSNEDDLAGEAPYTGYYAEISLSEKKFSIRDNCGGIPRKLAVEYAFMMGRPEDEDDTDIPTVGMYGIGMKRALFKMGTVSKVTTQTKDNSFEVNIPKSWLTDDNDWALSLNEITHHLKKTVP